MPSLVGSEMCIRDSFFGKGLNCVHAGSGKVGARHPGGACDSADSGVCQLGFCRRRVTPVLRVLRRLHRRVWRLPQTGAGGRFHQTHRAYISRATLDSERHWTPVDLEAGSIVWALKRLRGYLWGTKFRIFSDHKAVESIGNVGNHNGRVQRWLGVHHRVRLHARVPQRKRERLSLIHI